MVIHIYFWIGVVLCIFAIIVLTYIAMCIRFRNKNNYNYINNYTTNRFIMLISSDTISTLTTGLLLLALEMTSVHREGRTISECSPYQLLLRLSTFFVPTLTGLASIPSWMFHSYKCTDCNTEKNSSIQQRQETDFTKRFRWDKTTITMITIQWIIPILSILSMGLHEPETVKFYNEEVLNYTEAESTQMLTINMGITFCDLQNTTASIYHETDRIDKQIPIKDETLNTISTVVNEIYNIIKNHNETDNKLKPLQQIHPVDYTTEKNTNNLKTPPQITNKVELDNNTINILNNIANTIQNNEYFTKTINTRNLTAENNAAKVNILKLMENYTRLGDKENLIYLTESRIANITQNTTNNLNNLSDNSLNDINYTTLNQSQCQKMCQPSQTLLKKILFLTLFTSFFLPFISTSVLGVLIRMNMKLLKRQNDDSIHLKQSVVKLTERNTMIGLLTLSPTLIETITRTLLSLKVPEFVSSTLLMIAMMGMIIRNLAGIYLISTLQQITTVHPTQQSNENIINDTTQQITVQEIESTLPHGTVSTQAMQQIN